MNELYWFGVVVLMLLIYLAQELHRIHAELKEHSRILIGISDHLHRVFVIPK